MQEILNKTQNAKIFFFLFIFLFLAVYSAFSQKAIKNCKNSQFLVWKLKTKDGCSLFIKEYCSGTPVIVVHGGFGAEHSYMLPIIDGIKGKFGFVFYDQRGSLRSPCPDSLITFNNHINDLEEIRKALGSDEIIIIAHSMGGLIAMGYAAKYPQNLKGLILIDPCPAIGNTDELISGIAESGMKRWKRKATLNELRKNGLDTIIRKDYTPRQRWIWQHITFSAINLHNIENWRKFQNSVYYSQSAAIAVAKSLPEKWDYSKNLASLPFEISLIYGDDDYIPFSYQQEWLSKVKNCRKYKIQQSGHVCWLDKPTLFQKDLQISLDDYR